MEDVDFSITILSNGETVEISPQSVFRPLTAEGFACGDYGVTTDENMLIDGSYIHSRRLNARLLVISFEIFPICESEKYRSRLIHFLNPKNDFTVTVIRNGVKRSIENNSAYAQIRRYCRDRVSLPYAVFRGRQGRDLQQFNCSSAFHVPVQFSEGLRNYYG